MRQWRLVASVGVVAALAASGLSVWRGQTVQAAPNGATRVPVVFADGHETDERDRGRPVILIAAALGVPPEVFREAFSHVHPAPAGTRPDPEDVRRNKDELLKVLAPYGVTNERLDEVSNYYRYQRSRGEMWPTQEAVADALVKDGKITGFEVKSGGSGYSSVPTVAVPGFADAVEVKLGFSKVFEENGAVGAMALAQPKAK